jgi:hypothetical protein
MTHPLIFFRNLVRNIFISTFIGKIFRQILARPATGVIHLVCATRKSKHDFWKNTALGKSLLPFINNPLLQLHIHFENTRGLPAIYNPFLANTAQKDILLFVHDDIWLDSPDWMERLRKGLGHFDIIGVAGNLRLSPTQPAWLFKAIVNDKFVWDYDFLSGEVGHGKSANGRVQRYGPTPIECKVLDGVLLGIRCKNAQRARLRFDETFQFNFYDMDICRSAARAGLTMGTWPIRITHQSKGVFGSPDWLASYGKYLAKWNSR